MCVIRPARPQDLRAAAEVYLAAFPDTLRALGAEGLRPSAIEDLFAICYQAESEGFLVAEVEGKVVGYVICPADAGKIVREAIAKGWIGRLAWRWLAGRYGIGLGGVWRAVRDMIEMWRAEEVTGAVHCPARIVSIAVHPQFQGRGIGRKLMEAALAYLKKRGAKCVRLEVRPDNVAARRLYEKLGFREVGKTRDTRGPWVVMVLRLQEGEDE